MEENDGSPFLPEPIKKVHNICSSIWKFWLIIVKFCIISKYWLISKFLLIISKIWHYLVVFTAKLCWTICQIISKAKKKKKNWEGTHYLHRLITIVYQHFEIISPNLELSQNNSKLSLFSPDKKERNCIAYFSIYQQQYVKIELLSSAN